MSKKILDQKKFTFEISLSVLNHLGRNLYRNFITVLGEAISNSWDADAENVWIFIDREKNNFVIKDDGSGMDGVDFQTKFLKVGYSKRKDGKMLSPKGRPFIGAKGIGKLALLSCAERISVISKTSSTDYINGAIDNSGLDEAIRQEMTPDKYPLEFADLTLFDRFTQRHKKGTIVYFENAKEDIRNSTPYLKKMIALYFRFSLIDKSFNIFIDNKPVVLDDLKDLSQTTEFLWNINNFDDPYMNTLSALESDTRNISSALNIKGFIATVKKPKDLKITGTNEKVGVDLFVNGRLREKDLLKHIPTAQIPESYLYGQIHFDELDIDGKDRFVTSREGVVGNDDKYQSLLKELKVIVFKILDEWDELRLARSEDGDDDNARKSKKERRAGSLYNYSANDYTKVRNSKIKDWIEKLRPDAEFNIPAYVDCYLSENLVRNYIKDKKLILSLPAQNEIKQWRQREKSRKAEANISFEIREQKDDLSYLGMDFLAKAIDGNTPQMDTASLVRDSIEYKPLRNAVGHTALLTTLAKTKLNLVYENIKSRVKSILSRKSTPMGF